MHYENTINQTLAGINGTFARIIFKKIKTK
jgi:hypothetical protein